MTKLQTTLISCGFTEKEAWLYLAALSLGIAPIARLAKRAGLKRPTTYLTVESLLNKGLLVAVPRGKKVHYRPEPPQHIVKIISAQQSQITTVIPELEMLYQKNSQQPKIRFYEGKEKLITLYEEIFQSKEIWALVSIDSFLQKFTQDDEEHFFRILVRHNGTIHDIFEDTKNAHLFARAPYRTAIGTVKFLNKNIKTTNDVLVFDNNVATLSFENLTATVIEDSGIAATVKMMLQFMWNFLPEI